MLYHLVCMLEGLSNLFATLQTTNKKAKHLYIAATQVSNIIQIYKQHVLKSVGLCLLPPNLSI